jgi:hypothetical protein
MKKLALLALIALLVIGVTSTLASEPDPSYTEEWDGRGTDSERCDMAGDDFRPPTGWIHWVFSTKGESTDAELVLGGTGSGTYEPGEPLNAEVWHFYTPYFELEGLTATINLYGGLPGLGGGLVISDYCPGVEELDVNKTAETYYMRTHNWSIAKSVDPWAFHLIMDGSGDGTATWTVDVTYEGYEDSGWNVSGEITIENTGGLDAVITNIEDILAGEEIDIYCDDDPDFELPYTLPVGETLTCTYDEDVDDFIEGYNEVTVTTERDVYFDDEEIIWGEPDEVINETVTIVDDMYVVDPPWTVTAPNGDTFTYTKDFAWADYGHDDCGDYTYENTAEIIGDGDVVLDFAIADLEVYVQCYVFAGETAWAANGVVPGEIRYENPGNWATYVEYEEKTTTMFAGQTHPAGTAHFSDPVDGYITITITLGEGWEFQNVSENLKVQDYANAPSGNPNPGLFDHKTDCDVDENVCTIIVPVNNFYGVHADVGKWVPVSGSALLMYFQSMNFHPLYLPAVFGR